MLVDRSSFVGFLKTLLALKAATETDQEKLLEQIGTLTGTRKIAAVLEVVHKIQRSTELGAMCSEERGDTYFFFHTLEW